MAYKADRRRKKEKTMQEIATRTKKKYDKAHEGKKEVLIPDPNNPRTLIVKYV